MSFSKSAIARPATALVVVACFLLLSVLGVPANAASTLGVGGTVLQATLPTFPGLPSVEFQCAHFGFGLLHSSSGPRIPTAKSLTDILLTPEVLLRVNKTDVNASLGVSLEYDPSMGRTTAGISGSIMLARRRMIKFAVFRKETLALSYQWLPDRTPGGGDRLGIAGRNDTERAGALAFAAGMEMAVGRAALTTVLSYSTPTFDAALASAAHEFPSVQPGAAGLQCTVRWHQYTSVATMAHGGISVDSGDGTITYLLSGGVYGSPLPRLDYQVLAGAEAGVTGTVPVLDLQLTYKDAIKPGSRIILVIKKRNGILSASLRTKWALD
jgi:hypothetical protein